MMTANSESLARRAALADRAGQLLRMIEIRVVEERIQKLFSDGKLRGSTHLCNGQEAVAVGIAQSTRCDDTVTLATGKTVSEDGAAPNVHCSIAPFTTT